MRALLNLRAVNSTKVVFGENGPASLVMVTPALDSRSDGTTVTLTGSVFGSAGSFCAETVTVGSVIFGGAACPLWDSAFAPGEVVFCAAAGETASAQMTIAAFTCNVGMETIISRTVETAEGPFEPSDLRLRLEVQHER